MGAANLGGWRVQLERGPRPWLESVHTSMFPLRRDGLCAIPTRGPRSPYPLLTTPTEEEVRLVVGPITPFCVAWCSCDIVGCESVEWKLRTAVCHARCGAVALPRMQPVGG